MLKFHILFLSFFVWGIHSATIIPEDARFNQVLIIQKQSWDMRAKIAYLSETKTQNHIHQQLDDVVNHCNYALAVIYDQKIIDKNEKINEYLEKAKLSLAYAKELLEKARQPQAKL